MLLSLSMKTQKHQYPFYFTTTPQLLTLPLEEAWPIFEHALYFLNKAFRVDTHAFVLMKTHFHLIAAFPDNNQAEAMNYFKREIAQVIPQASYHRTRLGTSEDYMKTYKEMYRDPVESHLCLQVQNYPYSTLQGLLGQKHLLIPTVKDRVLFTDCEYILRWLNQKPAVQRTLRFFANDCSQLQALS